MSTLDAALSAACATPKSPTVEDDSSPDWDMSDSKLRAVCIKAAEADSEWDRFTVGTTTASSLINFI